MLKSENSLIRLVNVTVDLFRMQKWKDKSTSFSKIDRSWESEGFESTFINFDWILRQEQTFEIVWKVTQDAKCSDFRIWYE